MNKKKESLIRMKNVYEEQVRKLKEDWENGTSRFDNLKDYKIQLNIWEKRINQYNSDLNKC